jgi:hypothetical protein
LAQALRERLFVAQHDALDDPSPLSVQPRGDRACQPGPQPVGDPAKPASVAHDSPPVRAQDDVHAVAPAFVEAVLCGPRPPHSRDRLEHGTLRRSRARRELEQDGLVELEPPEAPHLPRNTQLEPGSASRAGYDHKRSLRRVRVP